MRYFDNYTANTLAGNGNQLYFNMSEGETRTGRIFYKINVGGKYNYSLLFSNILDSTYSDGRISHKNLICESYSIHSAKIGKCKTIESAKSYDGITVTDMKTVMFNGKAEKEVMPGEFFSTDAVEMEFESGEYLCLELTFSGSMIPYHEENLLPVFTNKDGSWVYSKQMPVVSMVGCDRKVSKRIAFIGDSITQGIGTAYNSYLHWNAVLAKKLGDKPAFWNLGLGYGRASDAASDGAWLYKAKQNDVIFVCYGVNDILQGATEQQLKTDLKTIVDTLKKLNKTVILQTVPPFDYKGEKTEIWEKVNKYIKDVLKESVDLVFDNVPVLSESEQNPHNAKYGGHPNEEGCAAWADALYEKLNSANITF